MLFGLRGPQRTHFAFAWITSQLALYIDVPPIHGRDGRWFLQQGRFIHLYSRETSLSQTTTNIPLLDYGHDEAKERYWGLTLTTWVQIVTVAGLMCALFRFNLARLWGKTNPINGQDSNWQHSVFVPLIGIYYLYIHREELVQAAGRAPKKEKSIRILAILGLVLTGLMAAALVMRGETGTWLMLVGVLGAGMVVPALIPTANAFGSVVLFDGLLIFAFGIYPGQNDYMKDLGMVITLFGVVTLLTGWAVMRVVWFPVVFLLVALPWPELVYSEMAWPLQKLAASVAVGTLRIFNVDAQNFGTNIQMAGHGNTPRVLNVAEACAGLKSVMTFLMVGGTVAFLSSSRPLWEKVVITLSAIPIAIFCNVVRVTGQGLLDYYWSHEVSEGFAHQFVGLIMVIPGFFLIMFVGWVLEKLFIEEVDRGKLARVNAAAAKSKRQIVDVPRRKEADASEPGSAAAALAGLNPVPQLAAATASAPQLVPQKPASPALQPIERKTPAPAVPAAISPPQSIPTATPAVQSKAAAAPAMTAPPSTLKPSSKPRTASATPAIAPSTTLKPSSKPPVERPAAPAVAPSTLKPSSGKAPRPPVAPAIPSSLRPPVRKPPAPAQPGSMSPGSASQPHKPSDPSR